ncbi:1838_t:CDS:2, partial [Dentiscutata heterogama]
NSIDTNGKGDVIRIFKKENKQDFNNRIFDIEFNKRTTLEQAKEVTTNLGAAGTILYDSATRLYYWRQNWTNKINKYSTTKNIDDIINQIIINILKSKPRERVIAFSTGKQKTNLFTNKLEIDNEQLQIQQNYQESLNNKIQKLDDFNYTNDVKLDIEEEELYKQFVYENKNNSLYQGL